MLPRRASRDIEHARPASRNGPSHRYSFTIDSDTVVRGLSNGVRRMRVGGRRIITVPYQLAYGAKGRPPKVPPKATLRFDVTLLEVGAGFVA